MTTWSFALFFSLVSGVVIAAPPRYALTELDPIDHDGASWGRAIHDDGRIAGARTQNRTRTVGTVWTEQGSLDYGPYDFADHAWATALGGDDVVFGVSRKPQSFGRPLTVWVSSPDLNPTILNYMPQYSYNSTLDVNAHNYAVGYTRTADFVAQEPTRRAFIIRVDGSLNEPTFIPTLGGWSNWANAVNDRFTVVGGSLTSTGPIQAFRWGLTGLEALGTLGGSASEATDINFGEQIVGWASTPSGHRHAFLHQGGVMTDLGTLGGGNSEATAINNAGIVVGQSWTANGDAEAFVLHDGVMHNLNHLTPGLASEGWVLARAEAINNSGVIVGWGTLLVDGVRVTRGFRLEPVCPVDWNADGALDFNDVLDYVHDFGTQDPGSDLITDGRIDFYDVQAFLNLFTAGCH